MTFEPRPHSKHAHLHKHGCGCKACRVWRARKRGLEALRQLDHAEKKAQR